MADTPLGSRKVDASLGSRKGEVSYKGRKHRIHNSTLLRPFDFAK